MKNFFGITESFRFEWADLSAILTILNVVFVVFGFWWAPILGLVNCGFGLLLGILNHGHINGYLINIALIVLNIYFLTL